MLPVSRREKKSGRAILLAPDVYQSHTALGVGIGEGARVAFWGGCNKAAAPSVPVVRGRPYVVSPKRVASRPGGRPRRGGRGRLEAGVWRRSMGEGGTRQTGGPSDSFEAHRSARPVMRAGGRGGCVRAEEYEVRVYLFGRWAGSARTELERGWREQAATRQEAREDGRGRGWMGNRRAGTAHSRVSAGDTLGAGRRLRGGRD